jgi:hypothetical protein
MRMAMPRYTPFYSELDQWFSPFFCHDMMEYVHMHDILPWVYPDFDENQKNLWGSEANSSADVLFRIYVFLTCYY